MPPAPQPSDPDRRDFMKKACCVAIGGVLGAVPVGAGVAFYLDPLLREPAGGNAASDGIVVRVASLDAVPPDNIPRRFSVIAPHVDAWTKEIGPIGAVYIRRSADNKLEAFNTVCPHAGGPVDYLPDKACYKCLVHQSTFKLDGSILDPKSPAPRGMDKLECYTTPEKPNDVMVKFQNFRTGIAQEIPLST